MPRIRALFLDLDGTLLDGSAHDQSLDQTCRRLSVIRPDLDVAQLLDIAKPEKAAFAPALDALAVSGKNVWHVGDNLETDVQGANAAGLTSVWLNRGGAVRRERDPTPDIEISSLSALAAHLLDLQ